MVNDSTPTNPTGSRFGWPNPLRIEEFRKLLAVEGLPTMRVVFREERLDLPTIRVPIGLPKYRLANGRTVSLQAEYLAKNEKPSKDLFDRDPELWEVQEVQHELLLELSRKTDLQDYFGDPANKQVDQILLDEFGFVVNGNRRMATWRPYSPTGARPIRAWRSCRMRGPPRLGIPHSPPWRRFRHPGISSTIFRNGAPAPSTFSWRPQPKAGGALPVTATFWGWSAYGRWRTNTCPNVRALVMRYLPPLIRSKAVLKEYWSLHPAKRSVAIAFEETE